MNLILLSHVSSRASLNPLSKHLHVLSFWCLSELHVQLVITWNTLVSEMMSFNRSKFWIQQIVPHLSTLNRSPSSSAFCWNAQTSKLMVFFFYCSSTPISFFFLKLLFWTIFLEIPFFVIEEAFQILGFSLGFSLLQELLQTLPFCCFSIHLHLIWKMCLTQMLLDA